MDFKEFLAKNVEAWSSLLDGLPLLIGVLVVGALVTLYLFEKETKS